MLASIQLHMCTRVRHQQKYTAGKNLESGINSVYVRCICMKMKQLEADNRLFNISYGNFENKRLTVKVHSTIGLYCTPFLRMWLKYT